jgi:hypothetical protein
VETGGTRTRFCLLELAITADTASRACRRKLSRGAPP